MSSTNSAAPLTLDLAPSRRLLVGLAACHVLAVAAVLVLRWPLPATLALLLSILISLAVTLLRLGYARGPWRIDRLSWSEDTGWILRAGDGLERPARLLASFVHPALVVLYFATGRFSRRGVALPADAADPDSIRRLRVWLLTRSADEPVAAPASPFADR